MRTLIFAIALVAFAFGAYRVLARPNVAPAVPVGQEVTAMQDGFEQILTRQEGRYSKHGWNHYGPGYFDLDPETGVLMSHGGMGLFWYAVKEYGDFILDLEYKTADERTNSGIFLRVPGVPTSDDYVLHSFEVQICDSGAPTFEDIHRTGGVYDAEAPSTMAANPPGVWNRYRITFQGNRITVVLNGTKVLDWDAEPRGKIVDFASKGYIGLQNHDDESAVYFRNISVKELP
ncbi:MAG: DUF1080 domain-containing protein [Gemmatimonadota bacterium]|nr:DUF1080 domain-containing protein [Gemmatimonadota bacterium]